MIALAMDLASDRCTVAVGSRAENAHRHIDGARRHAGMVLDLIGDALLELGADRREIDRIALADGPGSFTGLRVAASVAKALTWRRPLSLFTAPSLLVRAMRHIPAGGGTVLALSDALRGDVYAGSWQIDASGVRCVSGSPRAVRPSELAGWPAPAVVVAALSDAMLESVRVHTGRDAVSGTDALPDARDLLALLDLPGAMSTVADAATWQPDYGRPAEAQAVWERVHGRELPATPGIQR